MSNCGPWASDLEMLSGPLPNVYFLPKPLSLIGFHGKFAKNIKKSTHCRYFDESVLLEMFG